MKSSIKLLLVLAVVAIFSAFVALPQAAAKDSAPPKFFFDFKPGDTPVALGEVASRESFEAGLVEITRKGEVKQVGDLPVTNVVYVFGQFPEADRLVGVVVYFKSEDADKAMRAIDAKYGRDSRIAEEGDEVMWAKDRCTVQLQKKYGPYGTNGRFVIIDQFFLDDFYTKMKSENTTPSPAGETRTSW